MAPQATVARLWRYPVKSLLGESCAALRFDARGGEGDRRYAVRDADGKLGSGKNSRRMRQIDGLLGLAARFANGRPQVLFPDGTAIACDDPGIHAALSRALALPVSLAPESDLPQVDAAPVHILSTASLAWLREALPGLACDERRFRPNLVVDVAGALPIELQWPGRTLRIGKDLELRVIETTERCRMVNLAQGDLPEDARVLREVAQRLDAQFGVYAEVAAPGEARLGDALAFA